MSLQARWTRCNVPDCTHEQETAVTFIIKMKFSNGSGRQFNITSGKYFVFPTSRIDRDKSTCVLRGDREHSACAPERFIDDCNAEAEKCFLSRVEE